MVKLISKSRYSAGLQCEKRLWLEAHHRELADVVDEQTQAIFDQGNRVGQLARQLCPGGVLIEEDHLHTPEAVKATAKAGSQGAPTLYEAAAQFDRLMCRADILTRVKPGSEEWDLVEVKSTSRVKDEHLADIAFQKYVFEGAGYKIRKVFLCHINTAYVRQGELDIKKLFTLEEVTIEANRLIKELPLSLQRLLKVLDAEQAPEVKIGVHCNSPYECSFQGHCWKEVPKDSILYTLSGNQAVAFDLYNRGVTRIVDIPVDMKLNPRQKKQVEVAQSGEPIWNLKSVKAFLDSLVYPISFLDFETFSSAIPSYDAMRPYQNYVCQFSLHVLEKPGAKLKHFEFLGDGKADPRKSFCEALLKMMPTKGSVVTYSVFEKTTLNQTSAHLPQYRKAFDQIIDRMRDLLVPFRKGDIVYSAFNGSASIKAVLPVLVPEMSYDHLAIGEGVTAIRAYLQLMDETVPTADKKKIREHLLEYCGQDTLAMVKLLEVLRAKIG